MRKLALSRVINPDRDQRSPVHRRIFKKYSTKPALKHQSNPLPGIILPYLEIPSFMLNQHTSSTKRTPDPNVYENSTNSPGITVAGHVQPPREGWHSIDIFMSTSSKPRVKRGSWRGGVV